MKYAFIQSHRQRWPITVQCRVFEVSVSGYHGHVARQASEAPRRHLSDDALLVHIKAIHARTKRAYGRPRIWRELRKNGVRVGKQRLQTLMCETPATCPPSPQQLTSSAKETDRSRLPSCLSSP